MVEDDTVLRRVVCLLLVRHGYQVLAAGDGEQALAVAAAHPGPIDLLLTDVVLPLLDGPATARRLVAERPGIRVLFMTGQAAAGLLENGAELLAKPFTRDQALRRIRIMLERTATVPGAGEGT